MTDHGFFCTTWFCDKGQYCTREKELTIMNAFTCDESCCDCEVHREARDTDKHIKQEMADNG